MTYMVILETGFTLEEKSELQRKCATLDEAMSYAKDLLPKLWRVSKLEQPGMYEFTGQNAAGYSASIFIVTSNQEDS